MLLIIVKSKFSAVVDRKEKNFSAVFSSSLLNVSGFVVFSSLDLEEYARNAFTRRSLNCSRAASMCQNDSHIMLFFVCRYQRRHRSNHHLLGKSVP
jgi:hypothetical protein